MRRTIIASLAFGCMMMAATPVFAQQSNTVSGTVVDEKGEPIIGASVVLVGKNGTTTGVITDLDGKYVINAPKGSKVTITYIGYLPQTVTAGGKTQLKEDTQNLEEVVVVGYGVQKKAHLTGSVASVPVDEIQDLSSSGLAASLSGLVNGLSVSGGEARPGENARMYIRNTNDLGDVGVTAQEPLYVIDGFVYPNDAKIGNTTTNLGATAFNNLDPSEVESISVLKDASAAVYGARAANGVILVTTKKGKMGTPRISYSGTFGFTDEVARAKMLSAYDYGRLYNAVKAADPTNTSLNLRTELFQADELNAMKDLNYDLLDKYWETGTTMKHSVNISGATEKVNYFGGISYFEQDGNLGKLDYDRWNYRAGITANVSKWLKASITVSGDYASQNKPLNKVGGSSSEKDYNLLLTRPYYMPESVGDYPILSYGPSNSQKNQNQQYSFSVIQNNGDYSKTMTNNMNINGSIDYDFGWSKILNGLKLRFSYSKSINNSKGNEYGTEYTLYQMINRYGSGNHLYTPVGTETADDYLAESNFNANTISNGNYISRTMSRNDSYQINFTATYARKFGLHDLSALFSIEKSETESEWLYGQATKPYEFTTGQWNSVKSDAEFNTQFTRAESGTLSYIGRINYAYANKYLLEFLLRSDASTKFAPNNYWGLFPAVSAGWVATEEDWFKKAVSWIDYLKLRASFGITGRDNTAPWQWMQVYAQDKNRGVVFGDNTDSGSRITINKNNSAVNADVHWDKSYKANLGIDMNVLNSRLGITFEAYREWNREMLMNIAQTVPTTVGTQSAAVNLGEMDSWGYELSLTWKDKIGKDFKYRVGINTGYSDNKVLLMDWETDQQYMQITKGHRSDVGVWGMQCIGMFRSFQDIEEYFDTYNITSYMGLSKDQVRPGMLIYKDVRGKQNEDGTYEGPDGIVTEEDDQVQLSDRSSNIYGFTMNLGAEYKGFSLTAQFSASWGGYTTIPTAALKPTGNLEYCNMPSIWNPDNMYVYQDIYDASGNLLMAANRDASMPNLSYSSVNAVASTFWRVSNASVTLNRLTLAYTIPSNIVKKVGIQSARVNITGQNLINFYNPYPDNFISPMAGTYGNYPNLRKFTVGVNLSF